MLLVPIISVFGFCCLNVYTLEVLTRYSIHQALRYSFSAGRFRDRGWSFRVLSSSLSLRWHTSFTIAMRPEEKSLSGEHGSFFHCLFITCNSQHAILVCLFGASSVLVNVALDFDVPMPLHILVRSVSLLSFWALDFSFSKGSLLSNMAMETVFLGERLVKTDSFCLTYDRFGALQQFYAVVITMGVVLASYASTDTVIRIILLHPVACMLTCHDNA